MNTIGNQILSLINKLNLKQDSPAKGSIYILKDGSFVNLRRKGFKTHAAFDEFIVDNKITTFQKKLLPIVYCNAIRCNDGSNFMGEVIIELPQNPPTFQQIVSLEEYIDFLIDEEKPLVTIEINDKLYDIDLLDSDSYDIVQAIENYYIKGDSVFRKFLFAESKQLTEAAIEVHETLNPKLWTEDNKLKPLVRNSLIRVVNKYIENSDILTKEDVIDVELLGSNASYNYTENSDLDVHLVVNMEAVSCDPDLFQLACNAERSSFNRNYDITIKGIEIEMYVEDVKASTASNGIYSLYKDEWIKFPKPIEVPNYDNDEEYIALLDKWKTQAKEVLENAETAFEVQDYINNLYNLRRTSIMVDGEYGKGNLVFKEIRNEGLLDALKQKQYELSSKELSLESLKENLVVNFENNTYNINEGKMTPRKLTEDTTFHQTPAFIKTVKKIGMSKSLLNSMIEGIRKGEGEPITIGDESEHIVKVRVKIYPDKGKRGGGRVVYLDVVLKDRVYLLDLYKKNVQEDLTPQEEAKVREYAKEIENSVESEDN